jgi:hypothetical protein
MSMPKSILVLDSSLGRPCPVRLMLMGGFFPSCRPSGPGICRLPLHGQVSPTCIKPAPQGRRLARQSMGTASARRRISGRSVKEGGRFTLGWRFSNRTLESSSVVKPACCGADALRRAPGPEQGIDGARSDPQHRAVPPARGSRTAAKPMPRPGRRRHRLPGARARGGRFTNGDATAARSARTISSGRTKRQPVSIRPLMYVR